MRRKPSSLRNLKSSATDIVCRMCVVAKVKGKNGLAQKLKIKTTTIENWINSNKVPRKWMYYVADTFDSSFDFIELGFFFEPGEVLKDAQLMEWEKEYKYSYIKKPIKVVYIAVPFISQDGHIFEEDVLDDSDTAVAVGQHNIAVSGNNNQIGSFENNRLNTPEFQEFKELFKKYGNQNLLNGFIKRLKEIKGLSENV